MQFELIVRNSGNAPARDVRIGVRIFNAGADMDQEIDAFYAEPIREQTPPAFPNLQPGEEAQIRTAVAMPNSVVREINVQGRRLFIPMIAFNVVYDWGDGRGGQTSKTYLVGTEPQTPSEKMGAFRMDLGPRLYRSVGQRQVKLERMV